MVLRFIQWLVAQTWLMRMFNWVFGTLNPFLPEFRRDPHSRFQKMREQQPFYFHRVFQCYVATRYEDVQHVLRSKSFTTDRSQTAIFEAIEKRRFELVIPRRSLSLMAANFLRQFWPAALRFGMARMDPVHKDVIEDARQRALELRRARG